MLGGERSFQPTKTFATCHQRITFGTLRSTSRRQMGAISPRCPIAASRHQEIVTQLSDPSEYPIPVPVFFLGLTFCALHQQNIPYFLFVYSPQRQGS